MKILTCLFAVAYFTFANGVQARAGSANNSTNVALYYVSSAEDDKNAGTVEHPFATLKGARDAIRNLKKNRSFPDGGVTVWIRSGDYQITQTLDFTGEDSGTPDAPIVYAAYPGEKARLFGGRNLNREWFKPVTDAAVLNRVISKAARSRLLECDLGSYGITNCGELQRRGFGCGQNPNPAAPSYLYCGDIRLTLARWPNSDEHFPALLNTYDRNRRGVVARKSIIDPGPALKSPEGLHAGGVFSYTFDRPALWMEAEDLWLDGVFSWSWEWSYNKVAKIDPARKHIQLQFGEYSCLTNVYSGNWFYAENLLEEIDVPGEYYIDRKHNRIYLLPPDNYASNDPLYLSFLGDAMMDCHRASDLIFRDLVLDTGRGLGVSLSNCQRVRLEHCEVARFALGGVALGGEHCELVNCHVHDVGGFGITVAGGNTKTLAPGQNTVTNCVIHDWGWYNRVYTAGMDVYGAGNLVTHCRIYNSPHAVFF